MPVVIDNVLITFYQDQYNKVRNLHSPDSFTNPLSRWTDKRTVINDLHVVEDLNSVLVAVQTKDGRTISKPIDVESYYDKIQNSTHVFGESPRGIKYFIDHRQEMSKHVRQLNKEYQDRRGRIMRYLEQKISNMRPVVAG